MSDTIGRITVPTVINSGQTFPLATQYPFGFSVERPVIVHRFGSLDAKQEQRYYVGIGPRKFQFKRPNLGWTEANQLKAFWESMQGPWKAFTYTVPIPGGSTTGVLVTFEQTPVSFEYLRNAVQVGLNLIEVVDPTQAPTYAVNSTCPRFPSSALSTALLSEVQQIIPLVHIRVRDSAVADIYLSDRRVTVGGQLYLPRLIGIGEPGSDVLISQDIKGTSDNVRLTFGNGDRVMTQLANDTDLKYAEIDLCLFNVNSGILLQLWKGVIQNFTSDGTPIFPVTCSDGFFQIMNQYPERQLSRQCWKLYNDGVNCPWASKGRSATAVTAPRIGERMPGPRHGSLFRWAPGRPAGRRPIKPAGGQPHDLSILRNIDRQSSDHLKVLAVFRDERPPILDRSRRDERIESPQAVGFGIHLKKIIGALTDCVIDRSSFVGFDETVDEINFPLVLGARYKLQSRHRR